MTTIEDLPDCVLEQLLRHPALHHRDVRAAGQTCRRLRALCGPIWRRGRAAEIRRTWDEVHTPALAEPQPLPPPGGDLGPSFGCCGAEDAATTAPVRGG